MTEQQKAIIELRRYEGLTYKKIGERLRLGENWHDIVKEAWDVARIQHHVAQRGVKKRRGAKYPS